MKKVYLARSNRADPNKVDDAKYSLQSLDCELRQYAGGAYSMTPLLESDYLLMVPEPNEECLLGRGLYDQLSSFGIERAFVFVKASRMGIVVKPIESYVELDTEDWFRYGQAFLGKEVLFEDITGIKEQEIILL